MARLILNSKQLINNLLIALPIGIVFNKTVKLYPNDIAVLLVTLFRSATIFQIMVFPIKALSYQLFRKYPSNILLYCFDNTPGSTGSRSCKKDFRKKAILSSLESTTIA